ncbi:MAG: hypothetical protein WD342_12830 [Verrucomicrobiales bacterium]
MKVGAGRLDGFPGTLESGTFEIQLDRLFDEALPFADLVAQVQRRTATDSPDSIR